MFCTKCGRKLHDGDVFCAYCGNKVRIEEDQQTDSRYSDVVFNPPFKIEAQRRTEEISKGINQYSSEPKRERVDFNWNLEGFPGSKPRKDDDFQFNWDDVLEKRRTSREVDVEKIVPKQDGFKQEPVEREAQQPGEKEAAKETYKKEEEKPAGTLSIEELERELFGEAPSQVSKDAEKELEMTLQYKREDLEGAKDKFYTYNAKRDAFQELLDKEKAHIEKLEEENKAKWEMLAPEETQKQQEKQPPAFEDIFVEPELFKEPHLSAVDIALPPKTPEIMADEECGSIVSEAETAEAESSENEVSEAEPLESAPSKAELSADSANEDNAADAADVEQETAADSHIAKETEEIQEEEKSEDVEDNPPFQQEVSSKEKTKLRFSDVFPREDFDADGGSDDGSNTPSGEKEKAMQIQLPEDDEDEETKKRKPVLKIIIIILAVLVAIEVVIIGVKIAAPDSAFAKGVDNFIDSVASVFGGGDQQNNLSDDPEITTTYLTEYINAVTSHDNIGSISEDVNLKYDLTKDYAFEEIPQTAEFQNGIWKTADDGSDRYIGQEIVENMIAYYNAMKDEGNLKEGIVGINKLEIGEIRTGDAGYYVLTRVTYANDQGSETVEYNSVHLTDSSESISVEEIKEENL